MGSSAALPDMRPRRLLRQLPWAACDASCPPCVSSRYSFLRTRRALGLVLRRRGYGRLAGKSDAVPSLETLPGLQVEGESSMNARMFGSSLAEVFSTPAYDCKLIGSDQRPVFAVTGLCSGPRELEKAPIYPADQAVLICVSLTPSAIGQWQALYNGNRVGVTRAIPFATTFLDLSCPMEMWVRGPFDYLHYYL